MRRNLYYRDTRDWTARESNLETESAIQSNIKCKIEYGLDDTSQLSLGLAGLI